MFPSTLKNFVSVRSLDRVIYCCGIGLHGVMYGSDSCVRNVN